MGGRSNWIALFALALATLVVGLDATVLNVALPTISGDLNATTSQLQWIVNAYVLALAATILPAGVLADRYGRKRVLMAGLVIFFVGSLAGALTSDANTLIAMRAVMGVGAAVITPIVMALVPLMFDDNDRPKAVGSIAAASSIGLPLGLIVGGYLLNNFAWHSIFWINVPIVIIAFTAVAFLVQESKAGTAPRLDYFGAVTAIAGVVSLVYGFSEAPSNGWGSGETFAYIGIGIVLLAVFTVWQRRTSDPLIPLGLFSNRAFVGGTISVALMMAVLYGLLFTLPQYLQEVRGNDALGTGIRLIPMMAGLMAASIWGRKLLVRFGASLTTAGGVLAIAVALGALSFLSTDTNMIWIGLGLLVVGAGAGLSMTSAMNAVLGVLPRAEVGAGSAVTSTIRQIAGALGVAILGSILSSVYRGDLDGATMNALPAQSSDTIKESINGAMRVASGLGANGDAIRQMAASSYTDAMSVLLLICAGLGVIAAVVSVLIMRTPTQKGTEALDTAAAPQLQEVLH